MQNRDRTTGHASERKERLQKLLAASGAGSRRKCEELILQGRVRVDGEVVTELGVRVDPSQARIELNGQRVKIEADPVFLLINKPKGLVCTCSDPQGRPTVLDLVQLPPGERLFPVGRLDLDSQGLMLLTNDGKIAEILTHPRFEVEKEYLIKVRGIPTDRTLDKLRSGITLEDGKAKADLIKLESKTPHNAWLRVVIREGRNRLIRRMFQAMGHPVTKLKRVRLFYLTLGDMPEGSAVALNDEQISTLRRRCLKLASSASAESGKRKRRKATRSTGIRPTND